MKLNNAAWFLIGATLGSAVGVGVTYLYLKDKFDKSLNEEVNALKTHYIERDRALARKNEEEKKKLEEKIYSSDDINEFVNYAKMYSTETADKSYMEIVDENEDNSAAAEIISNVEWDDPSYDHYRKISVDYFEDGAVFETLSGEEIDGFELIAGTDWKDSFGEYTPGVVYVRNHDLKTDYEIIEQEGPHPYPGEE